jgi:flagellar basal-body rod modification protein FlgD
MSTTPISSLSSIQGSAAAASPAPPTKTLGKDEFLRLLTTQLQHQDPLSPMDSQAFVAQLAQFASVEQLDGLGTKLDTMLVGQASANQLGTASLVGKDVVFKTDRVSLAAGSPAGFEVTLPGAATDTTAIIADQNGRVVRTLPLGARSSGTFSVSWDGLDDAGHPLPAGDYVVTVSATAKDGTKVDAVAAVRGTISGITFEDQVPELLVQGRRVRMSDVLQIASPPAGA